jgi:uncharacterized membrane protein YcaP (DUF421 family)
MLDLLWSGWAELTRVLLVGTLAYFTIVLMLRGAGQQALTKMNAYGFVVTVALGSSLATALMSSHVKLDKAALAFMLLLALQRVFASLSRRYAWFRRLSNNEPALLFCNGRMLPRAMSEQNVTEAELHSAIRSKGWGGHAEIEAVILETDGSFSIIPCTKRGDGSALEDLSRSVRQSSA